MRDFQIDRVQEDELGQTKLLNRNLANLAKRTAKVPQEAIEELTKMLKKVVPQTPAGAKRPKGDRK